MWSRSASLDEKLIISHSFGHAWKTTIENLSLIDLSLNALVVCQVQKSDKFSSSSSRIETKEEAPAVENLTYIIAILMLLLNNSFKLVFLTDVAVPFV